MPRRGRYRRRGAKSFYGSPGICHLCCLPIPHDVVSKAHHLYDGTIDHVVPLSKGGPDVIGNRKPAHNICNRIKSNYEIIPAKMAHSMIGEVVAQLRLLGKVVSKKQIAEARNRIASQSGARIKYDAFPDIMRWEDEGGAVWLQKPFWRKKSVDGATNTS